MSDDIVVLKMEKSDFSFASALSSDSLGKESWKIHDFEMASENPQAILLIAKKGTEFLGYLASYYAADESELDSIAVSTAYRHKGVGNLILCEYINCLAKYGVKNIYLEVRESNANAISFYENHGFKRISKRKKFYEEPEEDAVVMKKELL